MDSDIEFSTESISSQNNSLEIEKECRRLEKLFYFYRDIDKKLETMNPDIHLANLRVENSLLLKDVVNLVEKKNSKFLGRLNHMWSKFLVTKTGHQE